MPDERWAQVDDYVTQTLLPDDPHLAHALITADAAGMPQIAVSAAQGHWLELLARSLVARHILELGTLAGYSTLWLARGVAPGGRVVTIERDGQHAGVHRTHLRATRSEHNRPECLRLLERVRLHPDPARAGQDDHNTHSRSQHHLPSDPQ